MPDARLLALRSASPTMFQFIRNLPTLQFQMLGGKTTSTIAIQLSNITLPEFKSNISIDSLVAYLFKKTANKI